MLDIFKFFDKKDNSKSVAKERLQLVLVHDRTDISPKIMEEMKNQIIDVINKFMEVDFDSSDIKIERQNGNDGNIKSALTANIVIKSMKGENKV